MGGRLKLALTFALMLSVCPAFAARPAKATHKHKRLPRHQKKPSWFDYRVFVPSHENLLSQNTMIDGLGLVRIKDKDALLEMESAEELVPITENKYVRVSPKLERERRYCRPWVNSFLQELGQAYYEQFNDAIQVNSAVRTVKTQIWLLHWNRNAAPWHGETASAHLAGVAVDLQRRGLTQAKIHFIQQRLLYLSKMNMVIVEEELREPCFHVVVTGDYPYPPKITIPVDIHALDLLLLNPPQVPTNGNASASTTHP